MVMPSIGFGTAGLGEQTGQAVHHALSAGYTLLDTAQVGAQQAGVNIKLTLVLYCGPAALTMMDLVAPTMLLLALPGALQSQSTRITDNSCQSCNWLNLRDPKSLLITILSEGARLA